MSDLFISVLIGSVIGTVTIEFVVKPGFERFSYWIEEKVTDYKLKKYIESEKG